MNLILKQFLIIGASFLIILWFQHLDDRKHKRIRKTIYDRFKFPLLVGSIIGLVLNLPVIFGINKNTETFAELTIITPVKECDTAELAKPFIHSNNFGKNVSNNKLTWFGKEISDQQIFTDLPDF